MDTTPLFSLLYTILILSVALVNMAPWLRSKDQCFGHTRLNYIKNYKFNPILEKKFKDKYPHFTDHQVSLVFDGLKEYFCIYSEAKWQIISMPSKAVDIAWHEFILFTKDYQSFCEQAFDHFLHHTPAEEMRQSTKVQEGIKRAWKIACVKHKINPSKPSKLPLIFAIDSILGIEDGFLYSLNCKNTSSNRYCVADIDCVSGCVSDLSVGDYGGCGSGD